MIRLRVPLTIPGANVRERQHWSKQRAEVSRWAMWFRSLTTACQAAKGKRRVRIVSYRIQRFRDHANLVGGCKGLIDGLVRAGLLVDDSIPLMEATYEQDVASASPERTACTLIEIEDC